MSEYKILVLRNKLPFSLETECQKAVDYFSTRLPFKVKFEFKDINIPIALEPYKVVQGFNPRTGQPAPVSYYGVFNSVKESCKTLSTEDYNCVILAYNIDSIPQPINGVMTSWTTAEPLFPDTEFIQLAINQYIINQDRAWDRVTHEIMHSFCYKLQRKGIPVVDEMDITTLISGEKIPFYKNDNPEDADGNYANTFENINPNFDKLLRSSDGYRYFTPNEVVGLKPELVKMLDEARGLAGIPFKITSGYRTPAHNASIGGASKSTHTLGLGVDISAKDGASRFKILKSLLDVGFKRIGIYTSHLHCDLGKQPDYPQDIIWLSDKD